MSILGRLFGRQKADPTPKPKAYFCNDMVSLGGCERDEPEEIWREHEPDDGPIYCPTLEPGEVVYRASTPPYRYTLGPTCATPCE